MAPLTSQETHSCFDAASGLWPLAESFTPVTGLRNTFVESKIEKQPVMLRFTPASLRDLPQVESELDWLKHLANADAHVAKPIPSVDGNLVETCDIPSDQIFLSAFEKAPGQSLPNLGDASDTTLEAWGRTLASIHLASRDYKVQPLLKCRRDHWYESDDMSFDREVLEATADDPTVRVLLNIDDWLHGLERNKETYGLVHGDMHNNNLRFTDECLTAFDFDSCCYHWYAFDLALPLYTAYYDSRQNGEPIHMPSFHKALLRGYRSVCPMDKLWEKRLHGFITYRIALLYHWLTVPERCPDWLTQAPERWRNILLQWCEFELKAPLRLV